MGNIKKLNVTSLVKHDNNIFVELQRQTFLAMGPDKSHCFSACLLDSDQAFMAYFFKNSLPEVFEAVREHEIRIKSGKSLFIMKINSARSHPIIFAPHELSDISCSRFLTESSAAKTIMARHPFAPYEAICYESS